MKFKLNILIIQMYFEITARGTFCPTKSPWERSGFYAKKPSPKFRLEVWELIYFSYHDFFNADFVN